MKTHPSERLEHRNVEGTRKRASQALANNDNLKITTAERYVIGYLCDRSMRKNC